MLVVRPELSKLTIITYKGKNFVKFDIKLLDDTIIPSESLECPEELKEKVNRFSTEEIQEG